MTIDRAIFGVLMLVMMFGLTMFLLAGGPPGVHAVALLAGVLVGAAAGAIRR